MVGRDRQALAARKTKQQAKAPPTTNTFTTEPPSQVEATEFPIALEMSRTQLQSASPNQILSLQRHIGNRAVVGLLARKPETRMKGGRRKFVIRRQPKDDNERLTPDTDSAHDRSPVTLHQSDKQIARKHLMILENQPWTGRTGKPEKKELYEAIQQRITMYNSTPPGKTAKDLSFDLMHLRFLEADIQKWMAAYGASETRGSYVRNLLTEVQTEATQVSAKLMIAQRQPAPEAMPEPAIEGGGGGGEVESKAGGPPPPPPMSPRPSAERIRELRDVVEPPAPVPKSGAVAVSPPSGSGGERKLPPPLPSVVPTGVEVSPSSPSSSSSSSSSPAMSSVAKLRQQMESQMERPEAPRERKTPIKMPKFGGSSEPMAIGSVVPVVSGSGTNLQNAVEAVYAAWHGGSVPMDGLSEENAVALGTLINQLYADREVMVSHPPPAGEQIRILELVRTITSGDAGAIRRQLVSLQLDEAVEDEEKEEEKKEEAQGPAPGSYVAKQNAKLKKLDQQVVDQMAIQGASKFSASLKTGVQIQKAADAGKVVVKAGISVGLSQVPGAGQAYSFALAVNQVRSTLKHMGNLKKIRTEVAADSGNPGQAEMLQDLDYILSKKKAKAVKSGVGGVPGLGTVKTGAYAIKGLVKKVKGTAGKHRQEVAERLVQKAIRQDVQAKMIVLELVGEDNYIKTIHAPNGADLLAAKIKSQ